jgi:iduronate 2-sulfatase
LLDESSGVPLIISVPDKRPAVCHSLVELLDLFPTSAALCGLPVPTRVQGKDISKTLDDPTFAVRDAAFSVAPMRKGLLLREQKWAYIQYGEDAEEGIELYDTESDPNQYTNLAKLPKHTETITTFRAKMKAKLKAVREHDLP